MRLPGIRLALLAGILLAVSAPAAASGGRIAFLKITEGSWQPWTVRADGGGERQIATLPVDVSRLSISGDGKTLLANGNDATLFVVDTASGAFRPVETEPAGALDAALSPDGKTIAFSANTLGGIDTNDIWLVPVGGGRAKMLTKQPYLQHFPVWGPGRTIFYLSGQGGQTHDIWRVAAGGGAPVAVLEEHLYNFEPTVSVQGHVAFSSNQAGSYDIWILEKGAAAPRRLTDDPAHDGQPAFSPDGRRVAFVSRRGGSSGLWIVDVGSGALSPVDVTGPVRMPCWYQGAPQP